MRERLAMILAPLLLLTGCATTTRGWTGPDTESFADAHADCRSRTAALGGQASRQFAVETCLVGKGWTPPRR
ncbi:MAG: hypothetical protein DI569_06990 [Sphingopyxis macrogoltabida]|uniref:Lipoprotein n=1 Tax=Sphingopyxis macrogoltabida TaxID=33050 RepID=A0A2W5N973_SPHMC|nr:MAG: hypothetical protein DI569_06990 [Sphingopyxis macrogoltabida]